MSKMQDTVTPYLTLDEVTDPTDVGAPDAGNQRLFVDTAGILKLKNDGDSIRPVGAADRLSPTLDEGSPYLSQGVGTIVTSGDAVIASSPTNSLSERMLNGAVVIGLEATTAGEAGQPIVLDHGALLTALGFAGYSVISRSAVIVPMRALIAGGAERLVYWLPDTGHVVEGAVLADVTDALEAGDNLRFYLSHMISND